MKKIILIFSLIHIYSMSDNEFVIKRQSTPITIPGLKEEVVHQALSTMESSATLLESVGKTQRSIIKESNDIVNGERITQRELESLLSQMRSLEQSIRLLSGEMDRFEVLLHEKKQRCAKKKKQS